MLAQRERDVLADGERVEEGALLEQHAHLPAHRDERVLVERLEARAFHLDAALVRTQEAVQVLQEDALPAAAAAEEDERLAGRHVEVDPAQHRLVAERLRDALAADRGAHVTRKSFVRKKSAIRIVIDAVDDGATSSRGRRRPRRR